MVLYISIVKSHTVDIIFITGSAVLVDHPSACLHSTPYFKGASCSTSFYFMMHHHASKCFPTRFISGFLPTLLFTVSLTPLSVYIHQDLAGIRIQTSFMSSNPPTFVHLLDPVECAAGDDHG